MMNILHTVELYSPIQGGAQEVIKQISERLVDKGHKVTIATTYCKDRNFKDLHGVHIEEFDVSGNSIRGIKEGKKGEVDRYIEFVKNGHFDIMMNYAAQQWTADCIMPHIEYVNFPAIFAPCGFSGLYNRNYDDYFSQIPNYLRNYAAHILHSSVYRDAQFYRDNDIPFHVITNAASETEFNSPAQINFRKKYGVAENVPLLLTVGSHTGFKGHRLVIEAFRQANIGKSVLAIIGNTVSNDNCLMDCKRRAWRSYIYSMGKKKVLVLDIPRDEVIAAYQAADVFVFGSNIECSPLVLFEAMASATPFIASNAGNSEEIAQWSEAGFIVQSEVNENGYVYASRKEFAQKIENVLADKSTLEKMKQKGKENWQKRFTWDFISTEYEKLYSEVITNHKQ